MLAFPPNKYSLSKSCILLTFYSLNITMTQKLNSYKTFKDKGLFICFGMIIAYIIMLIPLCWGDQEQKAESETETAGTAKLREPGTLTPDGLSQLMPPIEKHGSHERFKELSLAYGINPSTIREVENKYNLREGVVLCLVIAETSGGKKGYGVDGCWNYGNVGNNDRGDRRCFSSEFDGLSAVGRTLNNIYLGRIQTLGCLSNAGSCTWWEDLSSRYATSNGNWERTMLNCLNTIYSEELGEIDPTRFNVRRVYTIYQ